MKVMIFQFSLYGFLKNLRFFDPFFLLFLVDKGLSFTQIGTLFAVKEILVNLFNIPSGAIADLYGRKKSLSFALLSYVCSFIIFSFAETILPLYLAMFLFGIGDSFRAGTHKAMIFDYLRRMNRLQDKTFVYGYTRAWSQRGSAASVLIGAMIVYFGASYKNIFLYSIIPYFAGIINIMLYPSYLDLKNETGATTKEIFAHLVKTMKKCYSSVKLRHLIFQSSVYDGQFKSVKDYLQVLIGNIALTLPFFSLLDGQRKTAILIGIIYFFLYLVSSYASKYSHVALKLFKNEDRATSGIMLITGVLLILSSIGIFFNILWLSILSFVLIFNLQNIIRPIMTARYDDLAESSEQATVLSVESQSNATVVFILAPILGFLTDNFGMAYAFLLCAGLLFGYLFLENKH